MAKSISCLLLELPIAGSLLELRLTGLVDGLRAELPQIANVPKAHLNGRGSFEQVLEVLRQYLRRSPPRRTLIGTVNDICALAALRAFEEAGLSHLCAVMGQNAIRDARMELRKPGTRLIGTVAYFPERYGDELIPLAVSILQKKPVPASGVRQTSIDHVTQCRPDLSPGQAVRGQGWLLKQFRNYCGDRIARMVFLGNHEKVCRLIRHCEA